MKKLYLISHIHLTSPNFYFQSPVKPIDPGVAVISLSGAGKEHWVTQCEDMVIAKAKVL
jgi:hypothetical protein